MDAAVKDVIDHSPDGALVFFAFLFQTHEKTFLMHDYELYECDPKKHLKPEDFTILEQNFCENIYLDGKITCKSCFLEAASLSAITKSTKIAYNDNLDTIL
jgi:hypothetical protein